MCNCPVLPEARDMKHPGSEGAGYKIPAKGGEKMPLGSEQWIMRPFNGLFSAVFSGFIVLLIITSAKCN